MAGRPKSSTEWREYVSTLAGEDLYSQLVACNSQDFINVLLDEGATMGDLEKVLRYFVRQCRATDTRIPTGGPFDLLQMSYEDEQASQGVLMTEDAANTLAVSRTVGTDDIDSFLLDAEF